MVNPVPKGHQTSEYGQPAGNPRFPLPPHPQQGFTKVRRLHYCEPMIVPHELSWLLTHVIQQFTRTRSASFTEHGRLSRSMAAITTRKSNFVPSLQYTFVRIHVTSASTGLRLVGFPSLTAWRHVRRNLSSQVLPPARYRTFGPPERAASIPDSPRSRGSFLSQWHGLPNDSYFEVQET